MTEAALRTPLCIYMTTKTLLRPMLHRLSPNEGRMHFFALLPHQLTKYSNAMAMVSMAGHVFVAIWHAARQATGLPTLTAHQERWEEIQVKYGESSWPESKPMLTITHPISSHRLIAWLNQPTITIAS